MLRVLETSLHILDMRARLPFRYGLTYFKVKLLAQPEHDLARLRAILRVQIACQVDFRLTLDGNEQFAALAITGGRLSLASVDEAPFGVGLYFDAACYPEVAAWRQAEGSHTSYE